MDNPGKFTSMQVLTKDDTPYREVFENLDKIRSVNKYSEDGGRSYLGIQPQNRSLEIV